MSIPMPVCYVVAYPDPRTGEVLVHEARATFPRTAHTRCGSVGLRFQVALTGPEDEPPPYRDHDPRARMCPDCLLLRRLAEAEERLRGQGVGHLDELLDRALYPGLLGLER